MRESDWFHFKVGPYEILRDFLKSQRSRNFDDFCDVSEPVRESHGCFTHDQGWLNILLPTVRGGSIEVTKFGSMFEFQQQIHNMNNDILVGVINEKSTIIARK